MSHGQFYFFISGYVIFKIFISDFLIIINKYDRFYYFPFFISGNIVVFVFRDHFLVFITRYVFFVVFKYDLLDFY